MIFTFDWQPAAPKYLRLNDEKDAIVRTEPTKRGYLWQYRKKYGFAESLEMAKEWVETLAEYYDIPARMRWITI
jgi:hypothetical protein